MHWKHEEDLGDSEKVSRVLPQEKTVGFRLLAEARPVALWRVPHMWGGGRWKSQIRKNVFLSPYVKEPLNSKVIKSFVTELNSRVFVFWDSYVLCIYVMNILCTLHIAVSGYGTSGLWYTELAWYSPSATRPSASMTWSTASTLLNFSWLFRFLRP